MQLPPEVLDEVFFAFYLDSHDDYEQPVVLERPQQWNMHRLPIFFSFAVALGDPRLTWMVPSLNAPMAVTSPSTFISLSATQGALS